MTSWRNVLALYPPPNANWKLVAEALDAYERDMIALVTADGSASASPKRAAWLWPLHRLHFRRNRLVYRKRFVERVLDRHTYQYLVRHRIADGELMAKWRRPGYRSLCSLMAVSRMTQRRTHSLCRVPLRKRQGAASLVPSAATGCLSCADEDCRDARTGEYLEPLWYDTPLPADWTSCAPSQRAALARATLAGAASMSE